MGRLTTYSSRTLRDSSCREAESYLCTCLPCWLDRKYPHKTISDGNHACLHLTHAFQSLLWPFLGLTRDGYSAFHDDFHHVKAFGQSQTKRNLRHLHQSFHCYTAPILSPSTSHTFASLGLHGRWQSSPWLQFQTTESSCLRIASHSWS